MDDGIIHHHAAVTRWEELNRHGDLHNMREMFFNLSDFGQKVQALADGDGILVYCRVGKHRSATFAAALLIAASGQDPGTVEGHLCRLRLGVDLKHAKDDRHASGFDLLCLSESWLVWFGANHGFGHVLPRVVTPSEFLDMLGEKFGHTMWCACTYVRMYVCA